MYQSAYARFSEENTPKMDFGSHATGDGIIITILFVLWLQCPQDANCQSAVTGSAGTGSTITTTFATTTDANATTAAYATTTDANTTTTTDANTTNTTYANTTVANITTTTDANTTYSTTTTTVAAAAIVKSNNNVWAAILGGVIGLVLVFTVVGISVAAYVHSKRKKVVPDSDTLSATSEAPSESVTIEASRRTIPSALSNNTPRPLTLTPFELKKLVVEQFPYSNFGPGLYSSAQRPRMSLKFVPPDDYTKTLRDEVIFRESILNYESRVSRLETEESLSSVTILHNYRPRRLPPIKDLPKPVGDN